MPEGSKLTRFMTPIVIQAGQQRYEALVGPGLLARTGTLIARKVKGPDCAIVSDENVAERFAATVEQSLMSVGFRPVLLTIPPGEQSKTLEQAERICHRFGEAGLDRSSFVVALGGGVVGDLAGFVAAIYHRGIPYVQIPTTLLALVDSSIGGKTAVNTSLGKNLIGAWHHPVVVISDTDTLATLSPRERKQGFAEIVKHALIRDAEMFRMLLQFDDQNLTELIRRNIAIKGTIVVADERETNGQRAVLNFGHTVGHAIERAGNWREFRHGEAVSLGIVAACEISVRKAGLGQKERDRVVHALQRFDLPTRLPVGFAKEKIRDAIRFDKKFERQEVRFVVMPAIGSARLSADVTMEDIDAAIELL